MQSPAEREFACAACPCWPSLWDRIKNPEPKVRDRYSIQTVSWVIGIPLPLRGLGTSEHMRKAFHFNSPRERYRCDAAIVWCFDNRFEAVLRKLVKRLGLAYYDPIRIAGGTKCLASPEKENDRNFVLDQIRISMRLHATDTVILMMHSDCGAYGGLTAFDNDA